MAVRFRHNKIIHGRYNSAVRRLTSSGGICFESQPGEHLSSHIFCGFIYQVTLLRTLLKPSQPGISSWFILATRIKTVSPNLPVNVSGRFIRTDKAALKFWHVLIIYLDSFICCSQLVLIYGSFKDAFIR